MSAEGTGYRIGSLFSGIGGLELGLERSGIGKTVWQVEKNLFCLHILERHWPAVERFQDVKEVGQHSLKPVDIICGGFPCQDISVAGKGAGLAGERSGLWYEMLRIINELNPKWVVIENVFLGWRRWLPFVRGDLWRIGYASVPFRVRACEVGLPHERSRGFIVAHPIGSSVWEQPGLCGREGWEDALQSAIAEQARAAADSNSVRGGAWKSRKEVWEWGEYADGGGDQVDADATCEPLGGTGLARKTTGGVPGTIEPCLVRGVHGVSNRVDRVKALGNAVVPQCAEVIGRVILSCQ